MATHPVPPPTTNDLDSAQRRQLLKSTQKLGALLGTTPRVIEHGSNLPPPLTPGRKAFRRGGKVFSNQSASSSQSSLSSYESDNFILIPSATDILARQHHKNASAPISLEFSHVKAPGTIPMKKTPKNSRPPYQRNATAPLQLSQPLLYRLRSRPTPPLMMSSANRSNETVAPPSPLSPLTPLSPLSPISPTVPTTPVKHTGRRELSGRDRRRKIAKLTRTLGETIPPELVFGPPPRSSSLVLRSTAASRATATATATLFSPTPSRRRRSITAAYRPAAATSPSNSNGKITTTIPALPAKDPASDSLKGASMGAGGDKSFAPKLFPPPTPIVTVTTTTTNASGTPTTTAKRRHRPRSLSLAHIPAELHRGVVIEQVQSPRESNNQSHTGRQPSRSLDEPDRGATARFNAVSSTTTVNTVEYGYRREREWSGEWNMKDMGEVMNTLRGLRVR